MKQLMKLTTALGAVFALGLAAPTAADAQNPGRGGEKGRGQEQAAERGGNGHADHESDRGRGARREEVRQVERQAGPPETRGRSSEAPGKSAREVRGPDRAEIVRRNADRRPETDAADRRGSLPAQARGVDRGPDRDGDDLADLFRRDGRRGLIDGCPPGLAKRNNGCLPPGQERQLARTGSDWLWRGMGDARYRFDDRYRYQLDPRGGVLGWVPALGGALAVGQPWPAQYTDWRPVPDYYGRYYGLDDRYQYRYADGALYGVDPSTQAIGQIAALLTGQPWTVGQAMPAGYDVYNVPYDYRSRYADTPDSLYRYSDGYVYQVDPTTRLVMAAIQLLT